MENNHINVLDLSFTQLKELVSSLGAPAYRAGQILTWVYRKLASSYDEMSDLPQTLRQKLTEKTVLFTLKPLEEMGSKDGLTRKVLFQLEDGKTLEATLMSYDETGDSRERRTVCVSTQVGCPIGCLFCATGQQGFERNLTPGEIIEQILYFAREVDQEAAAEKSSISRRPITNVVFMGMGEPLANYENVWQAITMLNSKEGLELGARQMTLSTSGLVPQILRLSQEKLHIELAVSLHAANNSLRNKLMPINQKYPLEQLIPACKQYFAVSGRRITFEYALFQGVNDSLDQARELADLLKGMNCSVNLIAGNPTACEEFKSSTRIQAIAFQKQLTALNIVSTIRVSRGTDIEAGCGQLKSRWLNTKK